MKKKVLVLTTVAFLLGGTITFAATKNYYADMLARQQSQMEEIITGKYEEKYEEIGSMQHRDMVMAVEGKRQEILAEAEAYMDEKIQVDADERREEHSQAIESEGDRILTEIKAMIDSLGGN